MRVESSGVTIIMQKHEPGQTLTQQQGDFHFCITNRTKTVTVWSRNKQRRCKSSNSHVVSGHIELNLFCCVERASAQQCFHGKVPHHTQLLSI